MPEFVPNPRFPQEFRRWLRDNLYDIAKDALGEIKRLAPKDTGHLVENLRVERDGRGVYYSLPAYGWYQERGTGVYGPRRTPIYPRRGRFLVWRARAKDVRRGRARREGELIFARRVKGAPARHYIERGLRTYLRAKILNLRR